MTFLDTESLKRNFKFTELQLLGQSWAQWHTTVTPGRGRWRQEGKCRAWQTALNPKLRRQMQAHPCEFQASLLLAN